MIDKIKLAHFNEKEKFHEIYIKEEEKFYNAKVGVYNYDLSFVRGYGETKEEALEDFKKKIKYLLNQYKKLEKMLFESENLEDKIIDVDYLGEEVTENN